MWHIEFEWRNVKEKSTWREGRHMMRGAPCRQEGKIKKSQHNERSATWREGSHAVSSASLGSREENFRGAKLTAKTEKNQWTLSNLFHFWYLSKKCRVPLFYNYDFLRVSCIPPHLSLQCRLVGKRARDIVLKMGKEVNMALPSHPGWGRTHVTNWVWMEKR